MALIIEGAATAAQKVIPNTATTTKRFDEATTDINPSGIGEALPKRPVTYFNGISSDNTVRGSADPSTFARRLPTPLDETLGTSFNEATDEQSLSVINEMTAEYDAYLKQLEEATGGPTGLTNPY